MLSVFVRCYAAVLARVHREERGMATAELLGNAALGVAALVAIWLLLAGAGRRRRELDPRQGAVGLSAGFTTVQYVLAVGFSMVVFVMLANVIVFLYGRGVVRGALDEGVHAATPAGAGPIRCEAAADDALDDLIGGMREQVTVACSEAGGVVRATADVRFRSWLPALVPDWTFSASATAVKERVP